MRPANGEAVGGRSNGAVAARRGILGIGRRLGFDRSLAVPAAIIGFIDDYHIQIILGIRFETGNEIAGHIGGRRTTTTPPSPC